ncbi:hypothetical protein MKW98_020734 [Papaver atlanticum]|uniref:Uncharacterized protein n=1 Tax=Papaver atlanticum TaxID=357466 RepID=A0AAD4TI89_9MAGN|nr:hypothetical protein MKW98_020734 [Papaver atlanticum]
MATKKNISLIGFFFTLISMHSCFTRYSPYIPWLEEGLTCLGEVVRSRYSPTDDVQGDCIDWCKSVDVNNGILCAQMNLDENRKVYCACYSKCDPREDTMGPNF